MWLLDPLHSSSHFPIPLILPNFPSFCSAFWEIFSTLFFNSSIAFFISFDRWIDIYTHMSMCVRMCVYLYMEREREKERQKERKERKKRAALRLAGLCWQVRLVSCGLAVIRLAVLLVLLVASDITILSLVSPLRQISQRRLFSSPGCQLRGTQLGRKFASSQYAACKILCNSPVFNIIFWPSVMP